jgi:hypothetical protein
MNEMKLTRGGVLTVLFLSTVLIIGGCTLISPRTGMGALFATPEAALGDALGPQGWLSQQTEQLIIHQVQSAPEGVIATYSSIRAGEVILGLADAKPRNNRWYAHGMFGLPVPEIGDQPAACLLMPHTMTGATIGVLTGRLTDASHQVEALLGDGTLQRPTQRDDHFILVLPAVEALEELRIVDGRGNEVARIAAAECASEG